MPLADHIIFGMYGFWLPNDPRGSWSTYVGARALYDHSGPATKTDDRRSVAHAPHNAAARLDAKKKLRYPPVILTGIQARAVARGFARCVHRTNTIMHACAIMPDHIHLVIARTRTRRLTNDQLVIALKADATRRLRSENIHPLHAYAFADPRRSGTLRVPKCFARGHWTVYLNTPADLRRAIAYVENNPIKDGLRPQRWTFVTPFDNDDDGDDAPSSP
ncbi:MAG: hypothetical protein ACF8PN_07635 [Phycisphaerales bacterium]